MSNNNITALIPAEVNLTELPQQVQQNKELADRAISAIEEKIKSLPSPDKLPEMDVLMGDKIEEEVNDLRRRGKEAEKINKERRMSYTRTFDEVKKVFISFEKGIMEKVEVLDQYSNAWNSEKLRRQREEEEKRAKKQEYENAKIDFSAHLMRQMELHFSFIRKEVIDRLNTEFYSCSAEQLEEYRDYLRNYIPNYPMEPYKFNAHPMLSNGDMIEIKRIAEETHIPIISSAFTTEIKEETERLISLIPARKNELKRIANDLEAAKEAEKRIAKEKKEREEEEKKRAEERDRQREQEANLEKMNKTLENEAVAPAVELTKGTSVKLKYDVKNHKQMLLVIQWWVENELHLLTIPDMLKRLSFMRTAASRALNKGERIEGVPTIEDVRTRRR